MKPRSYQRLASVAIAVGLIAVANAAPAAAGPDHSAPGVHIVITDPVPGGFASWDELFAMQGRMDAALAAIEDAAQAQGFTAMGSAIAAPENRELYLYWHGAVPTAVRQAIHTWSRVVPIRVFPARFSRDQLRRTQERLMYLSGVTDTEPNPDGSGVTVRVRPGTPVAGTLAERLAQSEAAVAVIADGTGGTAMSRGDDTAPYYAGARISGTAGFCTSGFAVKNSAGTFMYTAAHCLHYSTNPPENIYDGGGDFIGTTYRDNDSRDIGMFSADAAAFTWDGPTTDAAFSKAVQGYAASAVGNYVCTSGASSGIQCGIQVKALGVSYTDTTAGATHTPMVRAERADHLTATAQGDSGGPVFSLPSPDNGKVIAKGIISGGDPGGAHSTAVCQPGNCSWRVFYADMKESLSWYGMTLKTA